MAAITWSALSTSSTRSVVGTGAAADTFDTTANTAGGLNLDSVGSYTIYAEADSGQTITTAVNAKAYIRDPASGRWARAELFDVIGQTVTGVRTAMIGQFTVFPRGELIGYENNGGAVSSGNLSFRLIAFGRNGERL